MRYLSNLLILLALIGCAETKTDLSGNTPLKINDFNAALKNIKLVCAGKRPRAGGFYWMYVPNDLVVNYDEIIVVKRKK